MATRQEILQQLEELRKSGQLSPQIEQELTRLIADNYNPSKVASFLRGVAQEGTLGFADEISAGARAIMPGTTYEGAIARNRARDRLAREANPKTYTAGQLAGGLASVAVPAGGAARASLAAGRLGRTAAGALAGATSEGTRAFGHGEGGAGDRLSNVPAGAGVGAALGGAGGLASPLVGKVSAALKNLPNRSGQPAAVARAMSGPINAPGTPDIGEVQRRLQELGPESVLADVQGFQVPARELVASGGPGGANLARTLHNRAAESPARTTQALNQVGPQGGGTRIQDRLAKIQEERIDPLIAQADKDSRWIDPSEQLLGLQRAKRTTGPSTSRKLSSYEEWMLNNSAAHLNKGKRMTSTQYRGMHADIVRDMAVAKSMGQKERFVELAKQKGYVERALREADPRFDKIRASEERIARRSDSVDEGRTALSTSTTDEPMEAWARKFNAMSQADKNAYKAGVRDQLDSVYNNSPDGPSAIKSLLKRQGNRDKLKHVLGEEEAAAIYRLVDADQVFLDTAQKVAREGEKRAQAAIARGALRTRDLIPTSMSTLHLVYKMLRGQAPTPSEIAGRAHAPKNLDVDRRLGEIYSAQGPRRDQILGPLLEEAARRNKPSETMGTTWLSHLLAQSAGAHMNRGER